MIVIDEVPLLLELERRSSLVGTCGNRIPGEVDLDESDRHHGERQVTHRREVFGSGLLRAGWVVGAVAIAYLKIPSLLRERVAEHRITALGLLLGGLVLNHENPILQANDIRCDPVHRQSDV